MNNIEELKRFIYSATVTSGSGSQSFYIDAKSREEADKRATNNESDGMYADDSEVTDLDALDYEDETTVDDFGDFPLISREQSLIAQLEAAQKERDEFRLAFQQNEQAKQELFAQKDLLITANLNISRRAEKAEAELSAANEKLNKVITDDWNEIGPTYPAHYTPVIVAMNGVTQHITYQIEEGDNGDYWQPVSNEDADGAPMTQFQHWKPLPAGFTVEE
ncbi:TPA: hypothetical protein ACPZUA_000913 [Yersinia enterocolitica]